MVIGDNPAHCQALLFAEVCHDGTLLKKYLGKLNKHLMLLAMTQNLALTHHTPDWRLHPAHIMPLAEIPAFAVSSVEMIGPVILSVPHGGNHYPLEITGPSYDQLARFRSLEDSATSAIGQRVQDKSRPCLSATLSRAIIDLNRPATALDPLLFHESIPPLAAHDPYVGYVKAGYAVMPRLSGMREPLYDHKWPVSVAQDLINQFYHPYHNKLTDLITDAQAHHEACLLVDIHSMPSHAQGRALPDLIFGDNFGASLPANLHLEIDHIITQSGLSYRWNHPYAGGYITRHYGNHKGPVYALQIEVNRALYCKAPDRINYDAIITLSRLITKICGRLEMALV